MHARCGQERVLVSNVKATRNCGRRCSFTNGVLDPTETTEHQLARTWVLHFLRLDKTPEVLESVFGGQDALYLHVTQDATDDCRYGRVDDRIVPAIARIAAQADLFFDISRPAFGSGHDCYAMIWRSLEYSFAEEP